MATSKSAASKAKRPRQKNKGSKTKGLRRAGVPTLKKAIEAFFEDRDLAPVTHRNYEVLYGALVRNFGAKASLSALTTAQLRRFLDLRWGHAAPASYNARVAALQSLFTYCKRQGWLKKDPCTALRRRRVPRDETKAIDYEDLRALWKQDGVHLREKLFWRCLYSTAARAREVLGLNIEDLSLPRKRATVTGKGGHRETIVWDAGTARLMRRYVGKRKQGPLFVTYGIPNVVPADADRAPDGRARLSYERAWSLFRKACDGKWTLHQLRHSALTHLGEQGVSAPLLMAKSRHRDARTLARYVKPGIEAVAQLTARYDPERRYPQTRRTLR